MNRSDRALAITTAIAILVIVGLVISPWWVRITAIVVCAIGTFGGLLWVSSRPITETDRRLDLLDQELERREREERAVRRFAREQRRTGGFRG